MRFRRIVVALFAPALLLAGCGSGGAAPPAPASDGPAASTVAATVSPSSKEWSDEAVTTCRTFVNSVPNMSLVKSQIANFKQPTTQDELNLAATGWGLAAANVHLPARLGIDAEPEVYQAMQAVAVALDTSPVNRDYSSNPDYARINRDAFSDAIDVCTEVGVIPGS